MKIEFDKEYLQELFEDAKTSDKKHRFQPGIIKKYIDTVNTLRVAPNPEYLYKFKSLHYEKKGGDLGGIEAVWINDQYRLEFTTRTAGDEPPAIIICKLLELSNHYKK